MTYRGNNASNVLIPQLSALSYPFFLLHCCDMSHDRLGDARSVLTIYLLLFARLIISFQENNIELH